MITHKLLIFTMSMTSFVHYVDMMEPV